MKHQTLFSSKDKSKNIRLLSAAILHGALRVKTNMYHHSRTGHISFISMTSVVHKLLPLSQYKLDRFSLY